ncbi:MAG: polysaccharide deacetylase family protein [Atopostipes suicloacalis]|nr:polysaccharide deacetylase family protein [Atopostipes suicloacalis]MDN6730753.1 polysaccharide deacetylase family protein [Atopostipes suicloacalis]
MKRKLLTTIAFSSLLLAACQNEEIEESNENEEDITENVSEDENTEQEEVKEDAVDDQASDEEDEEIEYLYEINPETFSVVPSNSEEESEKLALLTFDDAPYGNSLKIADTLEANDLSAIFFVNGMYMEDEEGFNVIKELHERGFEIGNHTHTHLNLGEQSEEVQKREISKTNDIIEEAIGEKPRFFRAPHGVMTDYSKSLLTEEGMTWMNWSFGYDWHAEYQDADALTEITLNTPYLSDGANILMHDREWTAEAVPEIIEGLEEADYKIVDPKFIVNDNELEE